MSSKSIYSSTKVLPYVYMGIHRETGHFYIGVRFSKLMVLPPDQDLVKYRTSSKIVKPIFNEFDWIIIAMFFDKFSAMEYEQNLIHNNWNNELILNKHYQYNGKICFNNTDQSGERNPFYGKTHSEKTLSMLKDRCGAKNPAYGKNRTEAQCNRLAKLWKITNPDGQEFIILNLRKFCRENDLTHSLMLQVSNGNQFHHKQWKCSKLN